MTRHPALVELSRDHHHALVLAAQMRRADASSAGGLTRAFVEFMNDASAVHFAEEERFLLPLLANHVDADHRLIVRTLLDHVRLRALTTRWLTATPPAADELRAAGELLHDHVRMEERELFALLEACATEVELARLGEQLRHARQKAASTAP